MGNVSIRFAVNWKQLGQIKIDANMKLTFPSMSSNKPCIYRIDIRGSSRHEVYIGEAVKYNQRMRGYQTPGPTQRTNKRLNRHITEALQGSRIVSISVIAEGSYLYLNDEDYIVDMAEKHQRRLIENAALFEAYTSGVIVLNK